MKKTTKTLFTRAGVYGLSALMAMSSLTFTGCGKDYDDDIKNLQEEITLNRADLEKVIADYKTLIDNQIAVLEQKHDGDIQNHQTQINTIKENLAAVKTVADTNAAAIADLKLTDTQLSNAIKALETLMNGKLETIGTQINAISTDLNKLDSRVTKAEEAITGLKDQAARLQDALDALTKTVGDNKAANDEAIKSLNEQLTAVKDKLAEDVADLATYKVETAAKFTAVEKSITALEATFDGKLADVKTAYEQLVKDTNTELTTKFNTLESSMKEYKEYCQSQIDKVSADVAANKASINSLTSTYGQLVALYSTLNNEVKANYSELKGLIAELQAADLALTQKIADLDEATTTKLDSLQTNIDNNYEELLALIGENATKIDENSALIATNAQGIADNNILIGVNGTLIQKNADNIIKVRALTGFVLNMVMTEIADRKAAITNLGDDMTQKIADAAQVAKEANEALAERVTALEEAGFATTSDLETLHLTITGEIDDAITAAVEKAQKDLQNVIEDKMAVVKELSTTVKGLAAAITDLQNRIQSLTFLPDSKDANNDDAALLSIENRVATMRLTYQIASQSDAVIANIVAGFAAGTTTITPVVNKVTRALIENPFTVDSIGAGVTPGTLVVKLTCANTDTFGELAGSGIPNEVSENTSDFRVALQIKDATNNIQSDWAKIFYKNTSKLVAEDLTVEFASGEGEFVTDQATALAQTPAEENTFEIKEGVAQLAGKVVAKCVDITSADYIKVNNLGIVAVYNEEGVKMESHNFAINADSFELSVSGTSYVGNTYKVVIGAIAAARETINADFTTFGEQMYSTISVTVTSLDAKIPVLVANFLAGVNVVPVDDYAAVVAAAKDDTNETQGVVVGANVNITDAFHMNISKSGYSIVYTAVATYDNTTLRDNVGISLATGNVLNFAGFMASYTQFVNYQYTYWRNVRLVVKAEIKKSGISTPVDTKYFVIRFAAAE